MTTKHLILLPALATSLMLSPLALADESLSDSQTSFIGAQMLEGDVDVTIGDIEMGLYEDEDMERYGFFAGNTLYTGVVDEEGNTVDAIVEFFWFESSIDRGSDFYLAVIKARTSPIVGDYELIVDEEPVLGVYAETDLSTGTNAFRWDWSVPFESYGIDSYGEATLKSEYGIGLNAEGAAMTGETIDEDGNKVEGTVQVKGYVDEEFKVATQFQISLYSWEMLVHGTPGSVEWMLMLNDGFRNDQSAYHEMFLVMQADEGEPFHMDYLEVTGVVQDTWWWWMENEMSVALTDVVLTRPEGAEDIDLGDDDDDDDETDEETEEHGDDDDDVDGDDAPDLGGDLPATGNFGDDDSAPMACNSATAAGSPLAALLTGLILAGAILRRRIV
jgi:hypothetical protein